MKTKYYLLLVLCRLATSAWAQEVDSSKIYLEKERNRWNNSLIRDTTYRFNKKSNALLVKAIQGKTPGKALDVGMGQGRNSIFLAQQGWQVTGFDIADEAVAFANARAKEEKLEIKTVLESVESFDFGVNQWDLVVHVYEGCMEEGVLSKIKKSLKQGGIIVFEFFHRDAGIKMSRPDFGCETRATRNLFEKAGGFKIIQYEEAEGIADYGLRNYKLVKLVAERTN